MRRIPTNMPGLQQDIYRTDRQPFSYKILGTFLRLQIRKQEH
jgi:hypothetical protein